MAGLYDYSAHVDAPSIGPRQRPERGGVVSETASAMASWLARHEWRRPFYNDPSFIAEFGRAKRDEIVAACNELWGRADRAAAAAGMTITLPPRLGGQKHTERN
ncbi:hypothetical protein [Sphingopyxis flava]|uniref:Uncharacterized protein n=1 Tax=Sphingopyxis flava TaxID=1507287 RepID=A0A1T5EMY5_9SPHN|nr:hypothetical protein [Sphingopyxis flava]SKB85333.1 hypothetical protein SAMN06295937_102348 [Sphingopyxis flava]